MFTSIFEDVRHLGLIPMWMKLLELQANDEFDFRLFANHLSISNTKNILDVGSGICSLSALMSKNGYNVVAIEPEELYFKDGIRRFSYIKNLSIINESLEEHKGIYDALILRLVLQHVEDKESFMQNVLELLKPGGIAVILEAGGQHFSPPIPLTSALRANFRSKYSKQLSGLSPGGKFSLGSISSSCQVLENSMHEYVHSSSEEIKIIYERTMHIINIFSSLLDYSVDDRNRVIQEVENFTKLSPKVVEHTQLIILKKGITL
jgi:SAM-dependent methyltransferase